MPSTLNGYAVTRVQQQLRQLYYSDDRPVVMEDDLNVWPPHIYLHNIALALNNRLPDEQDRSCEVALLSYGSSHVVVTLKTVLQRTYVVRITSAVFETFQRTHPFWPEHKERSEVASMIALFRENLPVPAVYAFDEDRDHLVGGAWTLQEYIQGCPLNQALGALSLEDRRDAFRQLSQCMLQVFDIQFPRIGSLEIVGSIEGIRNLSESHLDVRVGKMVTLKGLQNPYIVGPPKECGPWDDVREWLKSVAQGCLLYQPQPGKELPIDQANIERVKQIIDEVPDSLFDGPLSVNGPWACDMWSLHNIIAVIQDEKVITLHFLDFEGMQSVPAFVRAKAPFIQDVPEEWLKVLLDFLLEHPGFRHAHEQGRTARHLLNLAEGAWIPDPDNTSIKEFREGIWDDDATLVG
ncbi:hypothetical protein CALCODRAFT_90227 [Calocera cornea HHB12733]|uniref:Aminoglycoside phosphotransferase domain-containing protein n=1 Tax=Calocera cornea HHB12733 TaxID=1353952 RepID=A0A165DBE9_9BASI|nr:hypothetical protein CALCODRAFT_90227 [Calocera cornea HHB12733]